MSLCRDKFKDKKRIIVKIGSSSLVDEETGQVKKESILKLVEAIATLKEDGKDVCLVSSGAIAVGRGKLGLNKRPDTLPKKQALAAIGQAQLMMTYEDAFAWFGINIGQVLLTRVTMDNEITRVNALNTFEQLFSYGIVPIVNENDSIATEEIEEVHTFGDNDKLSAIVTDLVKADLLILLSDIDGMYTDDPRSNKDATLISEVEDISLDLKGMAKDTAKDGVGTGGMASKLIAAEIALSSGADMLILNGNNPDNITLAMQGQRIGTFFLSKKDK